MRLTKWSICREARLAVTNNDEVISREFADFSEKLTAYEHFNAIDEEKRQRIVRAALEEFAAKDYQHASTNAIVARADISKGLLFHYFGDKAGLFLYLQTYVTQILVGEILAQTSFESGDVFEVLKEVTDVKLKVTARYPLEVSFLVRTMKGNLPQELRGSVDESVDKAFDSLELIASNLDESLLKDGLDKERVVKLIDWYCVGMTGEVLADIGPAMTIEEYRVLTKDVSDSFDFLRTLVYKDPPQPVTQTNRKG
jgi:AcrR family transcriptional regulator